MNTVMPIFTLSAMITERGVLIKDDRGLVVRGRSGEYQWNQIPVINLGRNQKRPVLMQVRLGNKSYLSWAWRNNVVVYDGYTTESDGILTLHESAPAGSPKKALILLNSTAEPTGPVSIRKGRFTVSKFNGRKVAQA